MVSLENIAHFQNKYKQQTLQKNVCSYTLLNTLFLKYQTGCLIFPNVNFSHYFLLSFIENFLDLYLLKQNLKCYVFIMSHVIISLCVFNEVLTAKRV